MSDSFPPDLSELKETFEFLEEWDERYEYLIELGKQVPQLPEEIKTEENRVDGCMSMVWLVVEPDTNNADHLKIVADSDSLIVKGLIVILLSALANKNAEEILQFDVTPVFDEFGLRQHLSPNRRNGLFSMVKRVKELATNF